MNVIGQLEFLLAYFRSRGWTLYPLYHGYYPLFHLKSFINFPAMLFPFHFQKFVWKMFWEPIDAYQNVNDELAYFNGISNHLRLLNAYRLGNCYHCTVIFTFFSVISKGFSLFFFFVYSKLDILIDCNIIFQLISLFVEFYKSQWEYLLVSHLKSFLHHPFLAVFHWSLSDSKSP